MACRIIAEVWESLGPSAMLEVYLCRSLPGKRKIDYSWGEPATMPSATPQHVAPNSLHFFYEEESRGTPFRLCSKTDKRGVYLAAHASVGTHSCSHLGLVTPGRLFCPRRREDRDRDGLLPAHGRRLWQGQYAGA